MGHAGGSLQRLQPLAERLQDTLEVIPDRALVQLETLPDLPERPALENAEFDDLPLLRPQPLERCLDLGPIFLTAQTDTGRRAVRGRFGRVVLARRAVRPCGV